MQSLEGGDVSYLKQILCRYEISRGQTLIGFSRYLILTGGAES